VSVASLSARITVRLPSEKLRITRAVYESARLTRTEQDTRLLVHRNLIFTAQYYSRALRLRNARCRAKLQGTIAPSGADAVADALLRRTGVILTSVHLGDFELAASWIAEVLGSSPVVPVSSCPSRAWKDFYDSVRTACGFTLRHHETRLADLEKDLNQGRLVILMLDRRPPRQGLRSSWFGQPAAVSAAAATLSVRSGAPVVSAATWTDGSGDRRLVFGVPRFGQTLDDAATLTNALIGDLEAAVRAAPEQLHVPGYPAQLPWELRLMKPPASLLRNTGP
jgi:lauroyl/myristoyl acyltransferase